MVYTKLNFEPSEFWIGARWLHTHCTTDAGVQRIATNIWLCLLPCLPIRITIWWSVTIPF